MIATILLGWFVLGAIGTVPLLAIWRHQRRDEQRHDYEMALARAGVRTINGECRRVEG
jgi:hypothetical protein